MDEHKRLQNERKFDDWETIANSGRRYWLDVPGRLGWKARYVKEVNAEEETISFYQEIYDENDVLVEVHHKYPEDTGHKRV